MKTELKPGMKVRVSGFSSGGHELNDDMAVIESIDGPRHILRVSLFHYDGKALNTSIHRRNIVSVFRKKKRKKHEIWVNEYANEGPFIKVCVYKSKRDADELASSDRIGPAKRYVLAKRQDA